MKITIEKKDETASLGGLSWSMDDDTNGEEMEFSSIKLYDIGSRIKVTDGGAIRYYGVIVSMEENIKPPHTYKALDFSYNLKGDEIIQFKKLAADMALSKLFAKSKIDSVVECKIPTKITKIYKGTILEIAKDILKKAGKDQGKSYYLEVIGRYVTISEKKKKKISPTFTVAGEGSISRSITDLRNEVKVVKGNKVLATAKDSASIKKLGTIRYIDEDEKITKAKATSEAKSQLSKLDRVKNTRSLTLLVTKGYWDIRKNRLIKIKSAGLNGWYNIKSATHSIEGAIHKVDIEVEWSGKI